MNFNIIISFIIAGMLLLMLAYMNQGVSSSSQELVLSQAKQSQKIDIQELISHDFPKIGYDFNDTLSTKIVSASDSKIVFNSNLDNSSDGSIEQITWELTANGVSNTSNENDYILRRTVGADVTDIALGVTRFQFKYYDVNNTTISTPLSAGDISSLKQIEVIIELQSAEKVSNVNKNNKDYLKTIWAKKFTPRNLPNNL